MRLLGSVGASPEAAAPDAKAVRKARVTAARRAGWKEVSADGLVPRGPRAYGWLADADTDAVYTAYRGVTFERGGARLLGGIGE